jgi:hypothetical protein
MWHKWGDTRDVHKILARKSMKYITWEKTSEEGRITLEWILNSV